MAFARTAETVDAADMDAPFWIVTSSYSDNSSIVHIPADDSERENPRSLCPVSKKSDSIMTKDTAVYPSGHRTVCRECLFYRRQE